MNETRTKEWDDKADKDIMENRKRKNEKDLVTFMLCASSTIGFDIGDNDKRLI